MIQLQMKAQLRTTKIPALRQNTRKIAAEITIEQANTTFTTKAAQNVINTYSHSRNRLIELASKIYCGGPNRKVCAVY